MRFLYLLVALALPLAAQKHAITHEDIWLMKRVGAPAVSPDGKWVVASVVEPSYEDGKSVSDLWIMPADGSTAPRRLTNTTGGEAGPTFSPDSTRLAFTAKREGDDAPQIYVLPLSGGEAQRVTSISSGAGGASWRPDGKAILFQSAVYPGARNDAENKKAAEDKKARKYKALVYEEFPIRFWDRWLDEQKPHIFVQELIPGALAKDVLAGTKFAALRGFAGIRTTDSPEGDLSPIWSPDGTAIIFVASLDGDVSAYTADTAHLFQVPAAGGEPVAITSGPDSYTDPRFLPDGKALYALHSLDGKKQLYSLARLARIDWPPTNTAPKLITQSWDRSVSHFEFTPDSSTIYMTAEDSGHDKIFRMASTGGPVSLVLDVPEGVYSGLTIASKATDVKLFARWGSLTSPDELAIVDPATKQRRMLTEFNKTRREAIDWQPPLEFTFTAKSGAKIHTMVVLPPAFDPSKKYPMVVFPHGGPHSMTKDQISVRWNMHLLASPGYVVVMPNFTGSTGFGEKFANDIHKDVLRGPGAEIEQAIDEAIRRYPCIDATRQAAVGASYGGYLMNWFQGNSTRFKALVNHAGLTDNASMWGATDGAYYWEARMGTPVWELGGAWRDQNPAAYAAKFKTPMLITHGEKDVRVPINQALEIYKLLHRQKVPTRLVVFPDHGHWILRGEDGRYHMKEVLDWLAKYL